MKDKFIQVLQTNIQKAAGNRDKKFLSELALTLIEVSEKMELDAVNKSQILNFALELHSKIATENYLFWYSSLSRIYRFMKEGTLDDASEGITKCNIDINLFRIKTFFSVAPLTSSTDLYFFRHGKIPVGAFRKRKNELTVPCIYLLLNYYQTLKLYLKKFPTNEYDTIKAEYETIFGYIQKKGLIDGNISLIGFWNLVLPELSYQDNIEIKFYGENEKRFLASKIKYDPGNGIGMMDLEMINPGTQLVDLNLIMNYLVATNQNILPDFIPLFGYQIKRPLCYGLSDFVKNYQASLHCHVSDSDLALLNGYKDAELRDKIAEILVGVDKTSLAREKSKPHSGYEISDMELPFYIGDEMFQLCIPVKSGQEIKKDIVSENYAYQIYKPFSIFGDKCLVIFVTAKKCSQSLDAYIKRMSTKVNWKVEILQEKELCQVLKYNGLLK